MDADGRVRQCLWSGSRNVWTGSGRFWELRDEDDSDVASLQAEAERLKSGAHRDQAEDRGTAEKWTKLAALLQEKEDLERRFGEQVVELEAEEGFR